MKKTIVMPIALLLVLMSLALVSGAIVVQKPLSNTNVSGSAVTFNVTFNNETDITEAVNASFFYNLSGAWTYIGKINNDSISPSSITGTLSTISLTDGKYSINCTVCNASECQSATTVRTSITIDNTKPLISFSVDKSRTTTGRTIDYSVAISDATSGVNTKTCTATDPEGTAHTLDTSAVSKSFELTRTISDGDWIFACSVTDYSGNSQTSSTTVTTTTAGNIVITPTAQRNNKLLIVVILIIAALVMANKK